MKGESGSVAGLQFSSSVMVKTSFFITDQRTTDRHHGKRRVIANPRARLVRLTQAAELVATILIVKWILHWVGKRRPGVHRERQRDRWIGVPVGILSHGVGSLQGIHEVDEVFSCGKRCQASEDADEFQ